jgi:hypothetical protein
MVARGDSPQPRAGTVCGPESWRAKTGGPREQAVQAPQPRHRHRQLFLQAHVHHRCQLVALSSTAPTHVVALLVRWAVPAKRPRTVGLRLEPSKTAWQRGKGRGGQGGDARKRRGGGARHLLYSSSGWTDGASTGVGWGWGGERAQGGDARNGLKTSRQQAHLSSVGPSDGATVRLTVKGA